MGIELMPIGYVKNNRKAIEDDHWGNVISEIIIADSLNEECLKGLKDFSHAEIIFYFDQVKDSEINYTARHPRNNKDWPMIGIFAQRGKNRPNKIGLCIVKIIKCDGNKLIVKGLDAIDNTPVLDIKPVMKEFLPHEEIIQPQWSTELMKNYW